MRIMNNQKVTRIGIIGGIEPKTGLVFTEYLNNEFVKKENMQPDILLLNLPVQKEVLRKIVAGEKTEEMKYLLIEAVKRLNQAEVDFIVIPCNTVHIFIEELREVSQKPIISIIEETAKECQRQKIKTMGLLASTTTIQQNLHTSELLKRGIKTITPNSDDQKTISDIIVKIIHNQASPHDKKKLQDIIIKLHEDGTESILLACTDLQLLISQEDSPIPLFDTCKILEEVVLKILLQIQE